MSEIDPLFLEKHLASLRAWEQSYGQSEAGEIPASRFQILADEVAEAGQDLPGILPSFRPDQLRGHWSPAFGRYDAVLVRTWLEAAISILEAAAAQSRASPNIQPFDFSFINDVRLRIVLERDTLELQRAFHAGHWKSTIVLAGGALEAVIIDLLLEHPQVDDARSAPNKSDLTRWTLEQLIRVALELKVVNPAVGNLSHSVREFRNLIHTWKEIRENLSFGREEATIAVEVLKILVRDRRTLPTPSHPPSRES